MANNPPSPVQPNEGIFKKNRLELAGIFLLRNIFRRDTLI
jgi:hypothetical protein